MSMTKRDKMALKLKLAEDVLDYVRKNPRSTTKGIFLEMIKKNPYYAVLIFSQKPDIFMSVADLGRLEAAKTRSQAKEIVEGAIGSIMTKKSLRRSLMADLKRILENNGHVIYGSGMFGQVHESNLNDQDAAMWLAPRLSQIRHESSQWDKSVSLLRRSRRLPKDVANIESFTSLIRNQRRTNEAHESVALFFRRVSS